MVTGEGTMNGSSEDHWMANEAARSVDRCGLLLPGCSATGGPASLLLVAARFAFACASRNRVRGRDRDAAGHADDLGVRDRGEPVRRARRQARRADRRRVRVRGELGDLAVTV